jgi:peroxiredoxin Q/BCP
MAQLRDDYDLFTARQSEILVAGPETENRFQAYWREHRLPFVGLPDPDHRVLKLYGQKVKLFKLGRLPAQVVVDNGGWVRYAHYGHAMSDIPANAEILAILDQLNSKEAP